MKGGSVKLNGQCKVLLSRRPEKTAAGLIIRFYRYSASLKLAKRQFVSRLIQKTGLVFFCYGAGWKEAYPQAIPLNEAF